MSVLFLTEQDVRELLNIEDAMRVVEQAFLHLADGSASNMSRQRIRGERTMLHILAGADRAESQLGWKIYTTTRQGARFLVGLYNEETGTLAGLLEADFLGQLRTAAASGIATKFLARPDASRLGIIGTGLQARTQAWAIQVARDVRQVRVYGRDQPRRTAFARQLEIDLGLPVLACDSASDVVANSDILVTATTSQSPVFSGTDLQPGTHLCAIGSNFIRKSELDLETFRRVQLVCCDSREQCQREAGDFQAPLHEGLLDWENIHELAAVVAGKIQRPHPNAITLFKSVGLGLQDVALGTLALARAHEAGRGQTLPI
ncbi:MAG: ornithine cyclodeaminase family protein [Planctomycetaceae bacterium]|nr:ornithine cyclodeaminase family protein [Planctomycetaceae bacterium]